MPKIVQIGMGGSDVASPPTELTTNLDPALLFEDGTTGEDFIKVDTTTDANKLVLLGTFTEADNQSSGFAGIREGTPKAPLHIVGTGGSTGMTVDPTNHGSPTVFIENSTNNSKSKCVLALNADGANGSQVELRKGDAERLRITGSDSGGLIDSISKPLKLTSSDGVGQYINFTTGGAERLRILNDGEITTGGETTPQCAPAGGLHIQTGTGSTLSAVHTLADDLVVEGATNAGATFVTGGTGNSTYIMFADDDDNQAGALFYGHGQDRFEVRAGQVWISTFTNTGQVNGAELQADYLFQAQDGEIGIVANSADANGQSLVFTKSRNATDRSHTVVNDDDVLGEIEFKGSDGNSFALGAKITARVDGTPGDGDMPTELVFAVSADGSETPTEAFRIDSNGRTAIGTSPGTVGEVLRVRQNHTSDTLTLFENTGAGVAGEFQTNSTSNGVDILRTKNSSGITFGARADGAVFVGASCLNNKEFEVNNGTQAFVVDVQGTTTSLSALGNNNSTRQQLSIGSSQGHGLLLSKYGTAVMTSQLGEVAEWIDNQTNANRSAFLADSNTDLVLDWDVGQVGIIELVDNIDKIKFFNCPQVGRVRSFTLRIKQHASSAKTVSYSTIEFYTDKGSTAVSGTATLQWAGGVTHTMSTGTSDIDIVQFTAFSDTSNTVQIYGAVIGQNFS